MNVKKQKYRGALFVQQALILAFVIAVGVVFLNNKGLSGSIETIFDNGVELLASAIENEPSNGGPQQGNNSSNVSDGGSTNEGASTEPSNPLPKDDPNFASITAYWINGYNSLGGLASSIIYPFYDEIIDQIPWRDTYNQYQAREFDYISWENNKVTIGFNTINGISREPLDITVSNDSELIKTLTTNGIYQNKGTIVISDAGQLIQRNSDKSVYTSLDILKHDGTKYIHYGY